MAENILEVKHLKMCIRDRVGAICLTMFSLNFIGDGLSDAFDPKRKQ